MILKCVYNPPGNGSYEINYIDKGRIVSCGPHHYGDNLNVSDEAGILILKYNGSKVQEVKEETEPISIFKTKRTKK